MWKSAPNIIAKRKSKSQDSMCSVGLLLQRKKCIDPHLCMSIYGYKVYWGAYTTLFIEFAALD